MKQRVTFISIIIAALLLGVISLTGCTESCSRRVKSFKSEVSGGLNRTLVLMDYEGDTIKEWSGKFDIRDDSSDNKIFFDLNGKRIWIQGGIVVSEEY